MNKTEQGVLQKSKLVRLLIHILLLSAFCLAQPASAETLAAATKANIKTDQRHHVSIVYSPDSMLQSDIIRKLSDNLNNTLPDVVITKMSAEQEITHVNDKTDLIIGIGSVGMQSANRYYPKSSKLFISTDPEKFRLDSNTNKNDAILYMTQSYCRKMQLIKLINDRWKVISLLNSQKKPVDTDNIKQCASRYGIEVYTVNTTERNMTDDIKNALNHSDVLLALPDKSIYNSNTVKNILLTSYRHRKPIIAFSRNFVNAGALASIHSSVEQVVQSASSLIEQYFKLNHRFEKSVNHPQSFDISINSQVFRALDISIPDVDKLRQAIKKSEPDRPGEPR